MVLTKNSRRQKGWFIASNGSYMEANERFQVSYWRFLVAGSQSSSKSSLQPEDGCLEMGVSSSFFSAE